MQMKISPWQRNQSIDFLRGIAILLVMILHFHLAYRLDQGFFAEYLPITFIRRLATNGNYGVTIFFVISGFLITRTSMARFGSLNKIRPLAFYSFRFARIIPSLLLMLALVVGFGYAGIDIFNNHPSTVPFDRTILSVLTFWHNHFMKQFGYFNYCLNTLWSLSVEEVFYLFFPLVCLLLRRPLWIVLACILLVIAAPMYRNRHAENEIIALYDYVSCFDGITIGCLVALLKPRWSPEAWVRSLVVCLATLALVATYFQKGIMGNVVYGVSFIALSTGFILLVLQDMPPPQRHLLWAPFKIIQNLGRNSYELYLFHVVILALLKTYYKRAEVGFYAKPILFLCFLLTANFFARFIARFFSDPLNSVIRKRVKIADPSSIHTKQT